MKNNFFCILFFFFIFLELNLNAQELEINADKVQFDNIKKISVFEGNVNSSDKKGNKLFSESAKFYKADDLIKTIGKTKIITSGGFEVVSANVTFDNKKKRINSNYKTQIKDLDGNTIFVDMFSYSISTNIFFSKGNISVQDINNNKYNFSEIYIDENKKKIIGSDVKALLNQSDIGFDKKNEPRFFANTMILTDNVNTLDKGVFTYCKNRKNNKCPPWVLQSKKINHDLAKKTIYYEDVVLKIYDFPIFYSPIFSHPDPTVKRRSGLLAPTLANSTGLGSGIELPYFWNLGKDKDLTLTPKLYTNTNPLMLAEYRQDFKNSFLILDAGYTKGYRKTSNIKTSGGRAHLFANFTKNLINEKEKKSNLEINLQKVSNDTYFKVHDINTSLVEKTKNVLESSLDLSYENKDFYFNFFPSVYEDINKEGSKRYEYLLPASIEKNIYTSEKYGLTDLVSNLNIKNYDTNRQTNFFVNDINWKSKNWLSKFGFQNHLEGKIKAVNYEANNTSEYKNESTNSELSSALGYFAKLALYKNNPNNNSFHTLTPKFLLRYAPGHMRDVEGGKLSYGNLFNLNKINELDVIESGLSASIGFEYKKNNKDSEIYSLALGQVISEKENMDIPSSTSLDQKFSDIVGVATYNITEKVDLNYNFSIDQGYRNFNYNEIGSTFKLDNAKFNVSYLMEKKHIGSKEFIQSGIDYKLNNFTELNFSTKRNLLTSSAEFYNLSYNYFNDCLKAGIAYRREFYTDRDVEPKNTLMFTISIVPFAQINTPTLLK